LPSTARAFGGALTPTKIADNITGFIHRKLAVTVPESRWRLPIGAVVGQKNLSRPLWRRLCEFFNTTDVLKKVISSQVLCGVIHEHEFFTVQCDV
jgi:hypothetical protein